MLIRPLALALLLAVPALPAGAVTPVLAPIQAEASFTTEELMLATSLDQLFVQFGPSLAETPESQGIPVTAEFGRAWRETALEAFDAAMLQRELEAALTGKFSTEEMSAFAGFFRSDFGIRITELERAVQVLPAEGQIAARDEGMVLLDALPEDSVRAGLITEMLALVSAEVTRSMVSQSVRGMLIGMAMAPSNGDIEVPWEEIDEQLAGIVAMMDAELEMTQRAISIYAYRELSDAELETYMQFLRTEPAKKFYAVVGLSIGSILGKSMSRFGEQLVARLERVSV